MACANGSYTLHLSGPAGLTDLAGDPIVGNDLSGDYVIPFQVQAPAGGISGNSTDGYTVNSQAGDGAPQNLGVLFADELDAGVTIIRGPEPGTSSPSTSTSDNYVIQLLQANSYSFALSGADLPEGAQVTLTNASGQSVPLLPSYNGQVYFAPLVAGTYTVTVGGWSRRPVGGHLLPTHDRLGGPARQRRAARRRTNPSLANSVGRQRRSTASPSSGGSGTGGGLTSHLIGRTERVRYRCERPSGQSYEPGRQPARWGG